MDKLTIIGVVQVVKYRIEIIAFQYMNSNASLQQEVIKILSENNDSESIAWIKNILKTNDNIEG